MTSRARRLVVLPLGIAIVVLVASAAFATVAVTSPGTNPFTVPGDGSGNPVFFNVSASGFSENQPAFVMQCDGVSPASAGYSATDHCDVASGNTPVNAAADGAAFFDATDASHRLSVFKGESPQSLFNCLSLNDPPMHGVNGLTDYRNCQVRVSAGVPGDTANQAYFTIVLPDDPSTTTTTGSTNTTETTETTSTSTTTTTVPDTTKPVPKMTPLAAVTLGNKITVKWSATDAGGSGLANYDVQYRTAAWNGSYGSWTNWKLATTTATGSFTTIPGHTVCFRSRARDHAGNTSNFNNGTCTVVPLKADHLSYSSGWSKTSTSAAYGGVQYSTKAHGKTMSRSVIKGKKIWIVVQKCSSCGVVQVKFNGAVVATVNLSHAGTLHKQVVQVANFTSVKTGTLLVTVTSSRKTVVIEGVGVFAG